MNCPICSATSSYAFDSVYAKVAKCGNGRCGHLYALSRPTGTGVHEHAVSDIGVYAHRNRVLVDKLVERGFVRDDMRVLDIGSGLGHIMEALRRKLPQARIVCAEAAPQSVAHLSASGFEVVEDFGKLAAQRPFDALFMIEVIEHLDDPMSVLRLCHSLLRPQGVMLLTTPSGELRGGSHGTAAYETVEHVQFFTRRSLALACRQAGFSSVRFVELPEFYAGPANPLLKWGRDSLRSLRNLVQGKHHFVVFLSR